MTEQDRQPEDQTPQQPDEAKPKQDSSSGKKSSLADTLASIHVQPVALDDSSDEFVRQTTADTGPVPTPLYRPNQDVAQTSAHGSNRIMGCVVSVGLLIIVVGIGVAAALFITAQGQVNTVGTQVAISEATLTAGVDQVQRVQATQQAIENNTNLSSTRIAIANRQAELANTQAALADVTLTPVVATLTAFAEQAVANSTRIALSNQQISLLAPTLTVAATHINLATTQAARVDQQATQTRSPH